MERAHPIIHSVFGHFQNLNLLVLLEDLRSDRTAHGTWSAGALLCPVAHGMPAGQLVSDLRYLGQADEPDRACAFAARYLGADPGCVYRFVQLWDEHTFSPGWLLRQLEGLWDERLADAETVQQLLTRPTLIDVPAGEQALKSARGGERLSAYSGTA